MLPRKKKYKKSDRGLASLPELIEKIAPVREPSDWVVVRASAWWRRSMPHRTQKSSWPTRWYKGCLYITTANSAWAQEITFDSARFLPRMQKEVGPQIQKIRTETGVVPDLAWKPWVQEPPPKVDLAEMPHDLAHLLSRIKDDGVRIAVAASITTSLKTETRLPKVRPKDPGF